MLPFLLIKTFNFPSFISLWVSIHFLCGSEREKIKIYNPPGWPSSPFIDALQLRHRRCSSEDLSVTCFSNEHCFALWYSRTSFISLFLQGDLMIKTHAEIYSLQLPFLFFIHLHYRSIKEIYSRWKWKIRITRHFDLVEFRVSKCLFI